jgi:hypothetical protein
MKEMKMIEEIKRFEESFNTKIHAKLDLSPAECGELTLENYSKIRDQLFEEGFKFTERGESKVSSYGLEETWVANFEKDGLTLRVWYKKFQTKEERCAELRRQISELGCDDVE